MNPQNVAASPRSLWTEAGLATLCGGAAVPGRRSREEGDSFMLPKFTNLRSDFPAIIAAAESTSKLFCLRLGLVPFPGCLSLPLAPRIGDPSETGISINRPLAEQSLPQPSPDLGGFHGWAVGPQLGISSALKTRETRDNELDLLFAQHSHPSSSLCWGSLCWCSPACRAISQVSWVRSHLPIMCPPAPSSPGLCSLGHDTRLILQIYPFSFSPHSAGPERTVSQVGFSGKQMSR